MFFLIALPKIKKAVGVAPTAESVYWRLKLLLLLKRSYDRLYLYESERYRR